MSVSDSVDSGEKLKTKRGNCKTDWKNVDVPEGYVINPATNRKIKIGSSVYKKLEKQNESGNPIIGIKERSETVYEGANAGEVKKSLNVKLPKGKTLKAFDGKVAIVDKPKNKKEIEKRTVELSMEVLMANAHLRGQMSEPEFESMIRNKISQKAIDTNNTFATKKKKIIVQKTPDLSSESEDSDQDDNESERDESD